MESMLFRRRYLSANLLAMTMLVVLPAFAEVVPDGATATTVIREASGLEQISIAPPNAERISYNSYVRFDVSAAGVAFDNRGVGARTLVNEVTGSHPSLIAGPVRVLGAPANTIIANPNGITVNGGHFINTGSLGLVTGRLTLTEQDRRAVVRATTAEGELYIGEAGLSGTFNHLDLIAKRLTIAGPVVNDNDHALASVNLIAGDSEVDFFADASLVSPATDWRQLNRGSGVETGMAVTIDAGASLVGSRIEVVVTDSGAGVNHAGLIAAGAGDFELSSDGQVNIDGGAIEALADLTLKARGLAIVSQAEREQARVEAIAGGLRIDVSGDFSNHGGRLQGYALVDEAADSAVGFELRVGGDLFNYSLDGKQLAILFSQAGDFRMEVGGDLTNNLGRLISNADLALTVGGDFLNLTEIADFDQRGIFRTESRSGEQLWYSLYTQREKIYLTHVDFGRERIAGQLAYTIANGDLDIRARQIVNRGGEIDANAGSINLTAERVLNEGMRIGTAWLERRCSFLGCESRGASNVRLLGGLLQASDTVHLQAAEEFHNIGGRVYAQNHIEIEAPRVFHAAKIVTHVIEREAGLRELFHHDQAHFVIGDQGGSIVAAGGQVTIDARERIELMGGELLGGLGVNTNIDPIVLRERYQEPALLEADIGLLKGLW